ncbi:hypothetical protein HOK68_01725 [Candidatus Woesearchaeota archaeon]|jgi:hypothetical protein|nr:hypothetical protein [Candidatus Woesearchaeota archaeon]MBT4387319.1 hypothetical protein [Candidatus Woesearchaeota archaeon]MBT4595458.1 hypothetical protein [Candidatus Woesearchaeota archaeon]MBT5741173.1 hypothetical protein [Candidatus Woesearchaeota archaeon]MBT6505480.1 hypothetical protein [Candidatus Woesearchaeota archaeon]
MKKGQINLVFASIMGVIIIGLLFALAYRGIATILDESDNKRIPILVSDIKGQVKSHAYDYGSTTKKGFIFPNSIQKMYLVDYNAISNCGGIDTSLPFQISNMIKSECNAQIENHKKKSLILNGDGFFKGFDIGELELGDIELSIDYAEKFGDGILSIDLKKQIELEFEGISSKTKITIK